MKNPEKGRTFLLVAPQKKLSMCFGLYSPPYVTTKNSLVGTVARSRLRDLMRYCPPLLSHLSFDLRIGGKTRARQKKIISKNVGSEAGWARKQRI